MLFRQKLLNAFRQGIESRQGDAGHVSLSHPVIEITIGRKIGAGGCFKN